MEMQKHFSFLVLVYALGVMSSLRCGCENIVESHWNRSCIGSEKQALLLLKTSLVDDWNYLSSWVGDDICAIHSSLHDLKYLVYLDLSGNRFDEIQIPDFFGSFKDLKYLNLSDSHFKG